MDVIHWSSDLVKLIFNTVLACYEIVVSAEQIDRGYNTVVNWPKEIGNWVVFLQSYYYSLGTTRISKCACRQIVHRLYKQFWNPPLHRKKRKKGQKKNQRDRNRSHRNRPSTRSYVVQTSSACTQLFNRLCVIDFDCYDAVTYASCFSFRFAFAHHRQRSSDSTWTPTREKTQRGTPSYFDFPYCSKQS